MQHALKVIRMKERVEGREVPSTELALMGVPIPGKVGEDGETVM